MNNRSNSSSHYKAVEVLRISANGEPITYRVIEVNSDQSFVLKRTCLSPEYLSPEDSQRLETLLNLEDSRVVPYLGIYWHGKSHYVLRDYFEPKSLAIQRSFHPEAVRAIAIALLEVLEMLQRQVPRIVHGNIKPENIFVRQVSHQKAEVVLADFAIALSGQDASSFDAFRAEQLGFIPLEQVAGSPTPASDNYAVGAVVLGLLSGTPSCYMDTLTYSDDPHRYQVREILSEQTQAISADFIVWLERMLAPNVRDRFPDARTALQALLRLKIIARPYVSLSHSAVELQAERFGEQIQGYIRVKNLMPGTVLMGQWRVTPLPYDSGGWIQISPEQINCNEGTVALSVTTLGLQANQTYVRELIFQSNGERPIIAVSLIVRTAPLSLPSRPLPILHVAGLFIISSVLPIAVSVAVSVIQP